MSEMDAGATSAHQSPGLYPQLLGASWDDLAESVKRLHEKPGRIHATGTFRVRHGTRRLARWLIRLLRFPPAGEAVDVGLDVIPTDYGEEWRRTFAGRPLVSFQWRSSDGILAERIGPLEARFWLEVSNGTLTYSFRNAVLRLGPLRIPLPRWFAPQILGSETSISGCDHVRVSVKATMPVLGLLIGYDGTLTSIGILR
jgi:hypothetical protein